MSGLQRTPKFILSKPPLVQVICQVKFSTVLRLRERDAVIGFQEAIRKDYPGYSERKATTVVITPTGVIQQETPDTQYLFVSPEKDYTAILTPDFIALECPRFRGIDDFKKRMEQLVGIVADQYAPAQLQRLGLRFINEFRLPPDNPVLALQRMFSGPALGPLGAPEFTEIVETAQQLLELKTGNSKVLIRQGFQPRGTTVAPTEPLEDSEETLKPFYLLDFDAYSDQVMSFSLDTISERLTDFNDQIRSLFAWAVREDYRKETLGQKDLE